MKNISGILIVLYIGVLNLEAQLTEYPVRQANVRQQIINLSHKTDSAFDTQSDIINGSLYYPLGNNISHPYFLDNSWKTGKIWLAGRVYDEVTLKYDICSDYLIYLSQKTLTAFPVILNMTGINDFTVSTHRFTYLKNDDGSFAVDMKPGYYEIIYDGRSRMVVRWKKTETASRFTLETEYSLEPTCFLKKDGHYITILNQKEFLNSFNERKKDIRSYMKTNSIRFTSDDFESLKKVLELYDNHYFK